MLAGSGCAEDVWSCCAQQWDECISLYNPTCTEPPCCSFIEYALLHEDVHLVTIQQVCYAEIAVHPSLQLPAISSSCYEIQPSCTRDCQNSCVGFRTANADRSVGPRKTIRRFWSGCKTRFLLLSTTQAAPQSTPQWARPPWARPPSRRPSAVGPHTPQPPVTKLQGAP